MYRLRSIRDRFRAARAAWKQDAPMTGDEAEIVEEIMTYNPTMSEDEARESFWQWAIVEWWGMEHHERMDWAR